MNGARQNLEWFPIQIEIILVSQIVSFYYLLTIKFTLSFVDILNITQSFAFVNRFSQIFKIFLFFTESFLKTYLQNHKINFKIYPLKRSIKMYVFLFIHVN